jgi:hypothetical protein
VSVINEIWQVSQKMNKSGFRRATPALEGKL